MEILRGIVVLIHLIGFAVMFGGWFVEAVARRFQATRLMDLGVLISGIAGLALAAPWPDVDANYPKLGVKLVVLIIIGALIGISTSRQKKGRPLPTWVFWLIGALILLNAGIALLW